MFYIRYYMTFFQLVHIMIEVCMRFPLFLII